MRYEQIDKILLKFKELKALFLVDRASFCPNNATPIAATPSYKAATF
jgi:hypothetical protein